MVHTGHPKQCLRHWALLQAAQSEGAVCLAVFPTHSLPAYTLDTKPSPGKLQTIITKEMLHQDSDETPIAFHDVAAYFSEEEWKLLQQWQKELYTNVMKDIHHALTCLGYQIINPDILLRVNKGEEAYTPDIEDPERKQYLDDLTSSWYPTVHPDILLRIKPEEELCLRHGCDIEKAEICNRHSKGIVTTSLYSVSTEEEEERFPVDQTDSERIYSNDGLSSYQVNNPDILLWVNKGDEAYTPDLEDPERKQYLDDLTSLWYPTVHPDILFRNTQDEELSIGHGSDVEKAEICDSHRKGIVATSVYSLIAEEEEEVSVVDKKDSEKIYSNTSLSSNEIMSTKRNNEESVKCINQAPQCKMSTENVKVEMLQSYEKRANFMGQMWSESNPELGGETIQCEEDFSNSAYPVLYWEIPKLEVSDTCRTYASDLRNATLLTCQQNTHQQMTHMGAIPYQCTECEKSFKSKSDYNIHQTTHSGGRPYKCSDCDKSYMLSKQLSRHKRTHTGDRPFQCAECGQRYVEKGTLTRHYRTHSFCLKGDVMKHQRTHTGERLYQCTKCEKSFSQKVDHSKHQRTHTEKRPHQCTECEKSYDTEHALSIHMITHTEERQYQCTECKQRFKRKDHLNRHKRTHTGERPYQCTECEKSFIQKRDFIKHQTKHIVREENFETMACMREPTGLEPVRWTIEGTNELVSVPSNAGSTLS